MASAPDQDRKAEYHASIVRAEEGVIGCLMLNPREVLPLVSPIVGGQQFLDPELGKLFTICANLADAGKPIDNARWLIGELPKFGISGRMIGEALRLGTQEPTFGHAVYFAEQVRDASRLRKFSALAKRLAEKAESFDADPAAIEGWLDAAVLSARHGTPHGAELIGDVMHRVVDGYAERLKTGHRPVLLSGLPAADERGFVFSPGELTVIAARTSMGKTTLATQIGMYHAGKGRQVLMASLEMKSTEVASRLLASASGYNHQALRMGNIDQPCIDELREAANDIGKTPFRLWSPGRVKVGRISAMATLAKASHGLELLIVDLIQCIQPDDPSDKEHTAFGKATKGLRDIAQQLQVPVILVAQLNRGAEGERPTLSNLKGSGAIEEDADVVALLHADRQKSDRVDLIIEKNRFGALGTVELAFVKKQTRFADVSVEIEHNPNYQPEFQT
jgi:replicative DNA helicase